MRWPWLQRQCWQLIILAVLCCPWGGVAYAEVVHLNQARLTQSDQAPVSVDLPWDWNGNPERGGYGVAALETVFDFNGVADEPYGLYFVRIGNRAEVRLNGHLLVRYGKLDNRNGSNYAKAPRFIAVPQGLLKPKGNVLRIVLSADSGRHAGLSPIIFGPSSYVQSQLYSSAYVWRILLGSVGLMALCLLVGVVAVLLWRTQRVRPVGGRRGRRDVFYLYAGLTALSWAFYLANNSIQFVPLSWPWWGALVFLARAGILYGMLALARHVARAKHTVALPSWLRWSVRWMILCSLLALLGAWLSQDWRILVAWYSFETAWLLIQGVHYLYRAFLHKGSMSQRWVCIMLVVGVLAAAHDWCLTWLWQDPSAAYALQFSAFFQAAVLSWLIVARFNAVSHQGQRLLETLSHRLSARERKLHDSYQQLAIVQREQARMLERTRIMRDMHDGVGLHLVSAIRQLDDERNSRFQVAQTLRDAMDQLKLSIDVMSLSSGDVTGLLSSMRFRLAPRLESAGLTLHWQVSELPPVESMDTEQLGQLQYIVFEAISNVLQHANASALRVSAFDEGGELVVEIEDDGKGISAGEAEDQDAGSMQMRAAERGWRLTVQPVGNAGRGTRVRLSIPR